MNVSKYQHIVWDWNGTLLDDLDLVYSVLLEQLARAGLPPCDRETYRRAFRMPIHQFYIDMGFNPAVHDIAESNRYFHRQYEQRLIEEAALYPEVPATLQQISASGRSQCIVSAHPHQELEAVVHRLGIRDQFESIHGHLDSSTQGVSKATQAAQWMKESGRAAREVVWIGDTYHDAEIAQALGIDCVLVAHGHQSGEVLRTYDVPVVDSLSELQWAK